MKIKYEFRWVGAHPNCSIFHGDRIHGQSITQEAITDPVKGHLWDLKYNNCMVHESCDCVLLVYVIVCDHYCLCYKAMTVPEAQAWLDMYNTIPSFRETLEKVCRGQNLGSN
jgi:hypothetical protein